MMCLLNAYDIHGSQFQVHNPYVGHFLCFFSDIPVRMETVYLVVISYKRVFKVFERIRQTQTHQGHYKQGNS